MDITSTIPRCAHSVYKPDGGKLAFHCGLCNPSLYIGAIGTNFVMPRRFEDNREKLTANKSRKSICPKCKSPYYYRDNKEELERECAECKTRYTTKPAKKPSMVPAWA